MSSDKRPSATTVRVETLLAAFRGRVEPTPISMRYRIALALIAAAMVLLPIAYVGLIALTIVGVWRHLVNDMWIVTASGGLIVRPLAYGARHRGRYPDRVHGQTVLRAIAQRHRRRVARRGAAPPAVCADRSHLQRDRRADACSCASGLQRQRISELGRRAVRTRSPRSHADDRPAAGRRSYDGAARGRPGPRARSFRPGRRHASDVRNPMDQSARTQLVAGISNS